MKWLIVFLVAVGVALCALNAHAGAPYRAVLWGTAAVLWAANLAVRIP